MPGEGASSLPAWVEFGSSYSLYTLPPTSLCTCHLSQKLDDWPLSCDIGVPYICSITNLNIDAVGGEVLAQGIACL